MALNDSDSYVQYTAAQALGRIGDPRAVDPLILVLNDSASSLPPMERQSIRFMALYALVKIGEPAIDPLILALNDSSSSVRCYAADALGEIGDPRAVDPLIDALNDEDEDVREAAMEALEKIQSE